VRYFVNFFFGWVYFASFLFVGFFGALFTAVFFSWVAFVDDFMCTGSFMALGVPGVSGVYGPF
jgi:hypothetical protein